MRQRRRNIRWFVPGLVGFAMLGWIVLSFPPNSWLISLFFLLFFLSSFAVSYSLINNVRRAILINLGLVTIFVLRYLNLREPLYIILLVATLLSLELYFQKR